MKTVAELTALREANRPLVAMREGKDDIRIVVSMGTDGIAAGAHDVLMAFVEEVNDQNLFEHVLVRASGAIDAKAPAAVVYQDGKTPVTYEGLNAQAAKRIVAEHIVGGKPVTDFMK